MNFTKLSLKGHFYFTKSTIMTQLSQRPQSIICGDRLFFATLNLTQTKHYKKSSELKIFVLWI